MGQGPWLQEGQGGHASRGRASLRETHSEAGAHPVLVKNLLHFLELSLRTFLPGWGTRLQRLNPEPVSSVKKCVCVPWYTCAHVCVSHISVFLCIRVSMHVSVFVCLSVCLCRCVSVSMRRGESADGLASSESAAGRFHPKRPRQAAVSWKVLWPLPKCPCDMCVEEQRANPAAGKVPARTEDQGRTCSPHVPSPEHRSGAGSTVRTGHPHPCRFFTVRVRKHVKAERGES